MSGRVKYAPQDSLPRYYYHHRRWPKPDHLDLGIDAAVGSNVYAWNKVSGGTTTITGNNKRTFSNIQVADAGMFVKVTNPNARTNAQQSKNNPRRVVGLPPTELLTLVALYNATTGANWTNKWNLAQPITTWAGVSLGANGCVDTVELLSRNLVGVSA